MSYFREEDRLWYFFGIFFIVVILSIISIDVIWANWDGSEVITIKKSERVGKSHNSETKYIYAIDGQTFTVNDSWLILYRNSGDVYSHMEPGKTYLIRTKGWRNYWFSQYKNIINAQEITPRPKSGQFGYIPCKQCICTHGERPMIATHGENPVIQTQDKDPRG